MYKNSQSNRIDISNLSFVIFSAFSQASGQIRDIGVKWLDDSDGQLTARYDDDSAWDKIHNQEQENEENLPNSTRAPVQGVEIIGAGDQRHAAQVAGDGEGVGGGIQEGDTQDKGHNPRGPDYLLGPVGTSNSGRQWVKHGVESRSPEKKTCKKKECSRLGLGLSIT